MTYLKYDCVFTLLEYIGETQVKTKVKVIKTNNEEIILGIGYRPFVPMFGKNKEPDFACFFDDNFDNIKINLCDIKDIMPIFKEIV